MVKDLCRNSGIVLFIMAGALFFSSCIGPAGPPGEDGEDGLDGMDAAATCQICHNNDILIVARQKESQYSVHITGENFVRSQASCAGCHTHQGFMERFAGEGIEAPFDIEHPTPINCRTCHMIHVNFNESDWQLVTMAPVALAHTGVVVDLMGPSNLCIKCHQSRPVDPWPVPGSRADVTSSRYGPHHGPEANNLWGVGGLEFEGSQKYPSPGSNPHIEVGCVGCHMAPAPNNGGPAGVHTFNMTYEYSGSTRYNYSACTGCHPELQEQENFDLNGAQTEIMNLMSILEGYFMARGWMDGPGGSWNVPIYQVSGIQLGAMLNYRTVLEDGSLGVHNPHYMRALLVNAIETLGI